MTSDKHEILELPVSILRGGTSKGIYILEKDMPAERKEWDRILLRLMGSPDKKQIDGLGGAQSVTSKVAIIKRSDRTDADVDYTFAQVSVDKPIATRPWWRASPPRCSCRRRTMPTASRRCSSTS